MRCLVQAPICHHHHIIGSVSGLYSNERRQRDNQPCEGLQEDWGRVGLGAQFWQSQPSLAGVAANDCSVAQRRSVCIDSKLLQLWDKAE